MMTIYDRIEMALDALFRANEEYEKHPNELNKRAAEQAAAWLEKLEEKACTE